MITITSLTHPAMIKNIRAALYYASKGQGHMMNGHDKRCYIPNAKGHNIMRLNWVGGDKGYIVYGSESRDITTTVKKALQVAKAREYALAYSMNPDKADNAGLGKLVAVVGLAVTLAGCQAPGTATAVYSVIAGLIV